MRKIPIALATILFIVPSASLAAAPTQQQANSLIAVVQSSPGTPASAFTSLITAFSNITVAQANSLIGVVQSSPGTPAGAFVDLLISFTVDPVATQTNQQSTQPVTPAQPTVTRLLPTGSPYPSSNLGYDLSYSTTVYPSEFFNFGVIGVSGGKAFLDNPRFNSEVAWARVSSINPPTVYMNLNAPYGSTVAANIGGPNTCPARSVSTSTEPTACEGYNYGYNAATHAFAYAKSNDLNSPLWWLDIEEANSWSPDTAVNDATIQGAIDYLNKQGVRVGIYSVRRMWNEIAGASFVPNQTINGVAVSIPNWVTVGISNQINALNACVTSRGFIPGSPIWLVQYVESSTAIDQNIAC